MALIRKLDEAATALRDLAQQVRASAPEVTDEELQREMLESAEGLEKRAGDLAEAIERLRRRIN
ncbi:MAG TPA: hypothetical protein VMD92_11170 [Acidobacteriaceae bacterium]|nr:hypothetical protein [Acidobacteriaceae bacterium]